VEGECGSTSLYGVWGRSPQWGPGATPLVRGSVGEAPLKLTIFSHLTGSLNNENCTLFSIIDEINNNTICAGTRLIYKLDELVTSSLLTYMWCLINIDAMAL